MGAAAGESTAARSRSRRLLLDVDLEASAFTNAVRPLGLGIGERAAVPAAYVRTPGLRVERLEQAYTRLPDDGARSRYDYSAPALDYRADLVRIAAATIAGGRKLP